MHTKKNRPRTAILLFACFFMAFLPACTAPDEPAMVTPEAAATLKASPTLVEEVPASTTEAPTVPTFEPTPPEFQPQLDEEDLIAYILASADPEVLLNSSSPDANWSVEVLRYGCVPVPGGSDELAYEQIMVSGPGVEQHEVDHQLQYCGGMGAYGFNGLFWTTDSQFFYYDLAREGQPDGGFCGYWDRGITRIDVAAGTVEALPGLDVAHTPDGGRMLLWDRWNFILWDIVAGELGRVQNPFTAYVLYSGAIDPDGGSMVYVLRSDCFIPEAETVVGLLDLESMTLSIALQPEPPGYISAVWEADGVLRVLDFDGAAWLLDLASGDVTPAGP